MISLPLKLNQSGLLFVPRRWQRNAVLQWLKKIHAWTGFWGALLFLLMGSSGFLLNHRAQLKIGTGEPVEVSAIEIAVPPGRIADADALGAWAKQTLGLKGEARAPRPEGGGPGAERRGARGGGPQSARSFLGRAVPEREQWTRIFTLPDGRVTVSYVPGANHVSAKRDAAGFLGTIKNMHKGVGLGAFWVLFLDTIAGALVTMSITGFLLWSRLHGTRLLAGGIVGASLALALAAVVPLL